MQKERGERKGRTLPVSTGGTGGDRTRLQTKLDWITVYKPSSCD